MDARSRLARALDSPVLFLRHANRLYHRRLGLRRYNPDGVDPFEEDWDTLVLFDACRYDAFARRSELPGRLERRQSRGSTTEEFLRATVDGRDLRDTVYVTANPQLHRHRASMRVGFHDVIHVWRDGWDDDHGTVLPETVTEYALRARERYPDKRLVVHYLQPHYPFVESGTAFDEGHLGGTDADTDADAAGENVWNQLLQGTLDVDRKELWRLYDRNLARALPHAEELMRAVDGKTVVTADHGNMIGERAAPIPIREWGHPRGLYTRQLVDVPWLVFESGPRRDVTRADPADARRDVADEVVTRRLRELGYVDQSE